jgi:hypothetical protein
MLSLEVTVEQIDTLKRFVACFDVALEERLPAVVGFVTLPMFCAGEDLAAAILTHVDLLAFLGLAYPMCCGGVCDRNVQVQRTWGVGLACKPRTHSGA